MELLLATDPHALTGAA
ncbi:hypothetical protein CGLO_12765 [Colletotrichum gloeosporioides Cg-14]|uniref:Uncharacterized protein n=1 Tax=Colletotrichum gloeosporioides (strain Cg-14) TaxID=1237896 RepID=T0L8U2_COLGC|nr:hypothetical protein CGLO_12765 [Colletotrichum gloeosporioides Cg-14]